MKIHYFQRYHEKENVATANTMLLLSRLYSLFKKITPRAEHQWAHEFLI